MKKLNFIFLIALTTFATACIHRISRCSVMSIDRSMIPYQMGDTVHFVDAIGNYVTLIAGSEESEWDPYDDYIWEEYRTVHLQSEDSAYSLKATVQGWYYGNYEKILKFVFSSPYGNCFGEALYNKGGYFENRESRGVDPINNFEYHDIYYTYDSVIIGDYSYRNASYYEYVHSNMTTTSYYNKSHGVLQMTLDGKTLFTLQEYIPAR